MKIHNKFPIVVIVSIFLLMGCYGNGKKPVADPLSNDPYKKYLAKTETFEGYNISLPKGYKIRVNNQIDFSVLYFYPIDTNNTTGYRGGLYFGGHAAGFGPESDSCKVDSLQSPILGGIKRWTLYDCKGKYTVQIITDSKSGENWNTVIHAFGHAKSKTELHKIISGLFHNKKETVANSSFPAIHYIAHKFLHIHVPAADSATIRNKLVETESPATEHKIAWVWHHIIVPVPEYHICPPHVKVGCY
jgi:hypothetical protein